MKGTLFSADFIKDSSDNMRLLELNTDTAISDAAASQIDFTTFTDLLNTESISEVVVIYKLFHENIVTLLETHIDNNCPFITSFVKHLEERDTIYPTTVVDSSNRFILRMAYDENALLDSEYCKSTVNVLNLFADNNDLNSIPEFKYGTHDNLSNTINGGNVPDVVVKSNTTTMYSPIEFYKVGKSTETVENRFNEFKTTFASDVITNFYDTSATSCKSYRSLNIVYGSNLDILNLIDYQVDALFEKPTSDLSYDDTVINNKVDTKHYYEFSTNYIRLTERHGVSGLLSEEEIKKSDGSYTPISSIVNGDVLDSYIINGSPDSDEESVFLSWSHSGSTLPEGSSSTTSTVVSNTEFDLEYNMLVTLTVSGDEINMSPGTTVLVYQSSTDDIRYKFCYDLDITDHQLINVDGGLSQITSVEYNVVNEESTINSLDIEPSDVFFVKNAGGIRFAIHNCFPEGTLINTPQGSTPIQELSQGDEILSRSDNGDIVTSKLGKITKSKEKNFILITLDNGSKIKVTPKHPFFRNGIWVQAKDLKSNDVLKGISNDITVLSVENIVDEGLEVYNILNVEPNNNYFVEGVLVHNKVLQPVTCFSAGTRITMSDHSEKFIEEMEVGDEVFGWDGEKLVPAKVLKLDGAHTVGSHAAACRTLKVEPSLFTINDTGIEFTPEHPFLTKDGWKSLVPDPNQEPYKTEQEPKVLSVGDFINKDGEWVEVTEIRVVRSNPEERVYNLVIDNVHSYIADGIIVHNKL